MDERAQEGKAVAAARRNFYGRVHGKTLRASQKQYLAEDLGRVRLGGVTVEENPGRVALDVAGLFGGRPLWLEVGFGGGEHLVHMAARFWARSGRQGWKIWRSIPAMCAICSMCCPMGRWRSVS